MIQVKIKTNTIRDRVVTAELNDSVISVFESQGIDVSGSMTNLNGMTLTATDLNSTFQTLGVNDGETVRLNSVVKADGAKVA